MRSRLSDELEDLDYRRLKRFIIEATGLEYYASRDSLLAERVSGRLRALNMKGCAEYLECLYAPNGATELQILIAELTVGETYFFRHSAQFDSLRERIIPALIRANASTRRLRIWSAGCASGAEVYSLSIMLHLEFGHQLSGWEVTLLGTDINARTLGRAQTGHFTAWELRGRPERTRESCFTRQHEWFVLMPTYCKTVRFFVHNLATQRFPSLLDGICEFDLILCRNVLIYFGQDLVDRLADQFFESLRPGGYLMLGATESALEVFRGKGKLVDPVASIFQSVDSSSTSGSQAPHGSGELGPWTPPEIPAELSSGEWQDPLVRLAVLIREGRWSEAQQAYPELQPTYRLNPYVYIYGALIAFNYEGDREKSGEYLRQAIYLDRNQAVAHYLRGHLQLAARDDRGARKSFKTVIRLASDFEEDHKFLEYSWVTAHELLTSSRAQLELLDGGRSHE
jgi:chemotaxis protein methyltransferase CheR